MASAQKQRLVLIDIFIAKMFIGDPWSGKNVLFATVSALRNCINGLSLNNFHISGGATRSPLPVKAQTVGLFRDTSWNVEIISGQLLRHTHEARLAHGF